MRSNGQPLPEAAYGQHQWCQQFHGGDHLEADSDSRTFGNVADIILFYGDQINTNDVRVPYDPEYVARFYRYNDDDGRGLYRLDNMTSPNPRPNLTYEWRGHQPPVKGWRYSQETMSKLHDEGRIWYPDKPKQRPQLKRYLNEMRGKLADNVWTDLPPINSQAKERIGYPTQKPWPYSNASSRPAATRATSFSTPSAAAPPPASPPTSWAANGSASTSPRRPSIWSTCACSRPWAACSTTATSPPARTSPGARTSRHPSPTARTSTSSSASRRASATAAGRSSRSESSRSITSSRSRGAALTIWITCNCYVPAATGSRATGHRNTSWRGWRRLGCEVTA